MVTGLVFDGTRVTGVDYRAARPRRTAGSSAGEVILCGGAINSPQLLLLSGIGDARATSSRLGIPVVADLPGVGSNLQDHLEVYIQYASKQPVSIGPWLKHRHKPRIGAEWLFLRRGVGASNHFEAGGFIRSNDDVDYPNLMFHFLPIAIRYDGSRPAAEHGYQVHIGPMYSDVRGLGDAEVARPLRAPGAAVQLPVHRERPARVDRDGPRGPRHPQPAGVRGVQRRRALARARRWRPTRRSSTGSRKDAETALHPSCTARMGVDDLAVLDPRVDAGARRRRAARRRRLRRCRTSPTATSTPR